MTHKFELLVFDWDGTLMDSQQEIVSCFQWATRDLGMRVPAVDEIRNIIGLGMFQAIHTLFPELDSESKQKAVVDQYRYYYFSPEKPPATLFEGVVEMLNKLSAQGYLLSVATGKGRRGLDQALARTGLNEIFHFTRCVDEAHSKPHPQMLEDTMEYLGVDPQATLMIGDTEYDLLMAKNAGVQSVAVTCGAHEKARLLQHTPLVCMDQTSELEIWLNNP